MRMMVACALMASACSGDADTTELTGDTAALPAALFDLTFRGTGYTSHIDETVTFALWDNSAGQIAVWTAIVDADAVLASSQEAVLEEGQLYTLYLYSDHDLNGVCDPPPVDHGWTTGFGTVTADTEVVFDHDPTFYDLVCDGF